MAAVKVNIGVGTDRDLDHRVVSGTASVCVPRGGDRIQMVLDVSRFVPLRYTLIYGLCPYCGL
jgi:hypothetical protein